LSSVFDKYFFKNNDDLIPFNKNMTRNAFYTPKYLQLTT